MEKEESMMIKKTMKRFIAYSIMVKKKIEEISLLA
jgi:hypothetical protein